MKKIISYIIFYLIQFTWGILMNILGCCIALFMLITLHRPHRFGTSFYFNCKKFDDFGFSCGIFIVLGKTSQCLIYHECGHGIQNLMFGPLQIFISLASVIRFYYREIIYHIDTQKYFKLPDYDSIWFEGQATRLGKKFYKNINI